MALRRVVTGQSRDGRSVFVSDERLEPVTAEMMPGSEFYGIWGHDTAVTLPYDGSGDAYRQWFPPPAGFRFVIVTCQPRMRRRLSRRDPDAAAAEMEQKLPGLLETLEPDNPGMHVTDTVDIVLVLSGESRSSSTTAPVHCGRRHGRPERHAPRLAQHVCGAVHARRTQIGGLRLRATGTG